MAKDAREIMRGYLDIYFLKVIRNMIYTYEIVADSQSDTAYQKEYSTSRNEIVTIPQKYTTNTDYMIYGHCVAFITYKDKNPIGVVIEDPEIAHFERVKFMLLWKIAKEIDGSLTSLQQEQLDNLLISLSENPSTVKIKVKYDPGDVSTANGVVVGESDSGLSTAFVIG